MAIGIKHRAGYFDKTISQQIVLSAWSFYETTNKKLAENIGVSIRTIYNIKNGKTVSSNTKKKLKALLIKSKSDSPKISVLIDHYKRTGKTKKLSVKEVNKLLLKKADKIKLLQEKIRNEKDSLLYKILFY